MQRSTTSESAGISGGCDPHPVRRPGAASQSNSSVSWAEVAILTRSEDRVQLTALLLVVGLRDVAILTRSEDRVQRGNCGKRGTLQPCCDPHPVRRPGAAMSLAAAGEMDVSVAILTRSEDRVQPQARRSESCRGGGCDPHPVRRPGAARVCPEGSPVTAPRCDPHPVRRPGAACSMVRISGIAARVAILTRSEDRVQPGAAIGMAAQFELRSSPGPKTGCSSGETTDRRISAGCDPHPVRRPGAARSAPPRAGWSRGRLRSSPGPKTGCSTAPSAHAFSNKPLRSSPGPKTGCSVDPLLRRANRAAVAILTRSEDRVQLLAR